ncbi:phosphopentomutase [Geoalkalibacter subterraneus]|uniref:Phosphopentomutase n=1 Tax=Geoalkalibacter subterraneus TaxID=483547 RepID=A0A0B5FTB1_9BACT|nr:phosphopentomutase [Geoalkalibacter subterraneus]
MERVVLIVLDGVGVGALPDAEVYRDGSANTLGHVARSHGGLSLPHLEALGLGNILTLSGVSPCPNPQAGWGKMAEKAAGKDTTAGHWEIAGVVMKQPFATFPDGFPDEIMQAFHKATGLGWLGNEVASGTEIIARLGESHLRTGLPIIYTSVDSVFQIAVHEDIIPPEKLYEICRVARRILDPYHVGRVIARPFIGRNSAGFRRTSRRHDFSMPPPEKTVLDRLRALDLPVMGVGKIGDIFCGQGLSAFHPSRDNRHGMELTWQCLAEIKRGLVFTNLVDFDMLYGHRRDVAGFAAALQDFDRWLPQLMEDMTGRDLLIITADHGCDPTTEGTDHSREYVPLLVWGPALQTGCDLGVRASFTDIAATLGDIFGCGSPAGKSFLPQLPLRLV